MSTTQVNSICPFCGVGCGIALVASDNNIIAVQPLSKHPVSQGKLCAKGWNTPFGISRHGRLTQPLMKVDGKFKVVSWQHALSHIAKSLKQFIKESGPQSVGLISSARATNEDNYAAQKFARAVLKTNNIEPYLQLFDHKLSGGNNASISGRLNLSNNELSINGDIPEFGYKENKFNNIKYL